MSDREYSFGGVTKQTNHLVLAGLFAFACLVIGYYLGDHYIQRLPNHRGYFLVHVDDVIDGDAPARPHPPRRTVFIVVDGLRRDSAETMVSAKRIADRGQCRVSDQGSYTLSRPVYALLSTGLEVDRTGARNNDNTAPLFVESIWEVARKRGGYRVRGSSHLAWFKQLFPEGFDDFRHFEKHEENVFTPSADGFTIDLFHPLYVDEVGHHHGAKSKEYAEATARADREIAAVLDTVDFDRDLVLLTADHGHRDQGGHGGAQPEIEKVLFCIAGPNVIHRDDRAPFDGRVTAPLLAVLLGVPFPANMRAGDDNLDLIWEIAKTAPAYEQDRRAAVERFRRSNQASLERWLGESDQPATWPRLYAREANAQTQRTLVIALVILAALVLMLKRRGSVIRGGAWIAGFFLLLWIAHHLVLGDFDYTVINLRARYVPRAFLVVGMAASVAAAAHLRVAPRPLPAHEHGRLMLSDFATMSLVVLIMNLGHIFIYKWPLGFPLPSQPARYFPFFGAITQVGLALIMAAQILIIGLVERRRSA